VRPGYAAKKKKGSAAGYATGLHDALSGGLAAERRGYVTGQCEGREDVQDERRVGDRPTDRASRFFSSSRQSQSQSRFSAC
jgi:hypothetical protein